MYHFNIFIFQFYTNVVDDDNDKEKYDYKIFINFINMHIYIYVHCPPKSIRPSIFSFSQNPT